MILSPYGQCAREEKTLRHVAMVAKLLDDNKSKRHLKKVDSYSDCFKLHRSYLISFNFSNGGHIFWIESERTVPRFRKEKKKICVMLTYTITRTSEIKKFHVAVLPQRLRNVQKKRDTHAKLFSCQSKGLFT